MRVRWFLVGGGLAAGFVLFDVGGVWDETFGLIIRWLTMLGWCLSGLFIV